MVPVEASVSGVIGSEPAVVTDPQLKTARNRYAKDMEYLRSPNDPPGANGRSKMETYVIKQEAWSREVEKYSRAQNEALESRKLPQGAAMSVASIKQQREQYLQWLQEHGTWCKWAQNLEQQSRRRLTKENLAVQEYHAGKIHGLGDARIQVHGTF